ncbi:MULTISPECIES: YhcH/YjgK/YiaL family protein [Bacteroides]|uniref:YhcH/YjgK/YiaL family protein n=1 Tax=Bacteroides TaxID=816 RepID=UPI001F2166C7|nr:MULTISPECIES: YhcH/YjgK/YiaL family protein [Bacteroides]MCF2737267.1 YhcH/YjgK/YiaL family protein [Bacteroides caecigallinarum]
MIIDKLENIGMYASVNPLFAQAIEFLKSTDLNAHELGKVVLKEGELFVNFAAARPKTKDDAKIETHNNFIDIQIPLTGTELMGYMPRTDLAEAEYNAEKDVTFYPGHATDYLTVKPGMFAIFFPEDAHAPGVTEVELKKVIVKVRVK